jgi:hypothetical protein
MMMGRIDCVYSSLPSHYYAHFLLFLTGDCWEVEDFCTFTCLRLTQLSIEDKLVAGF